MRGRSGGSLRIRCKHDGVVVDGLGPHRTMSSRLACVDAVAGWLREALARQGMTMQDLEEDKWGPLGATMGRLRGW